MPLAAMGRRACHPTGSGVDNDLVKRSSAERVVSQPQQTRGDADDHSRGNGRGGRGGDDRIRMSLVQQAIHLASATSDEDDETTGRQYRPHRLQGEEDDPFAVIVSNTNRKLSPKPANKAAIAGIQSTSTPIIKSRTKIQHRARDDGSTHTTATDVMTESSGESSSAVPIWRQRRKLREASASPAGTKEGAAALSSASATATTASSRISPCRPKMKMEIGGRNRSTASSTSIKTSQNHHQQQHPQVIQKSSGGLADHLNNSSQHGGDNGNTKTSKGACGSSSVTTRRSALDIVSERRRKGVTRVAMDEDGPCSTSSHVPSMLQHAMDTTSTTTSSTLTTTARTTKRRALKGTIKSPLPPAEESSFKAFGGGKTTRSHDSHSSKRSSSKERSPVHGKRSAATTTTATTTIGSTRSSSKERSKRSSSKDRTSSSSHHHPGSRSGSTPEVEGSPSVSLPSSSSSSASKVRLPSCSSASGRSPRQHGSSRDDSHRRPSSQNRRSSSSSRKDKDVHNMISKTVDSAVPEGLPTSLPLLLEEESTMHSVRDENAKDCGVSSMAAEIAARKSNKEDSQQNKVAVSPDYRSRDSRRRTHQRKSSERERRSRGRGKEQQAATNEEDEKADDTTAGKLTSTCWQLAPEAEEEDGHDDVFPPSKKEEPSSRVRRPSAWHLREKAKHEARRSSTSTSTSSSTSAAMRERLPKASNHSTASMALPTASNHSPVGKMSSSSTRKTLHRYGRSFCNGDDSSLPPAFRTIQATSRTYAKGTPSPKRTPFTARSGGGGGIDSATASLTLGIQRKTGQERSRLAQESTTRRGNMGHVEECPR